MAVPRKRAVQVVSTQSIECMQVGRTVRIKAAACTAGSRWLRGGESGWRASLARQTHEGGTKPRRTGTGKQAYGQSAAEKIKCHRLLKWGTPLGKRELVLRCRRCSGAAAREQKAWVLGSKVSINGPVGVGGWGVEGGAWRVVRQREGACVGEEGCPGCVDEKHGVCA